MCNFYFVLAIIGNLLYNKLGDFMKKLIMTDLDCTLLPMDQDAYIELYVKEIAKLFYEHGYDGKAIAKATMKSSYMMGKNDGSKTNEEAFELAFSSIIKEDTRKIIDTFPEVYGDRYHIIKTVTKENPYAEEIVKLMKEHAEYIVVATQPMFPLEAVKKRLSWIGIEHSQFDHITTYDNCTFCKPNPLYYKEIMDKFSATPENTIMIGNDITEDILPCEKLGVETFLVEDGLINTIDYDISNLRKGSYVDLIEYLKTL